MQHFIGQQTFGNQSRTTVHPITQNISIDFAANCWRHGSRLARDDNDFCCNFHQFFALITVDNTNKSKGLSKRTRRLSVFFSC